jgi:pilus assembly protein Flp/PilA
MSEVNFLDTNQSANQLAVKKNLTLSRRSSRKILLAKDETGASAVEYSLLVGLIAVFLIASITTLGSSISETFREAACKISGKAWTDGTGGANGTCV